LTPVEAEHRHSLQAGSEVDLASQKCWGARGKALKIRFLPFIFTDAPQPFVAASITVSSSFYKASVTFYQKTQHWPKFAG